jgi:hypothetical protein
MKAVIKENKEFRLIVSKTTCVNSRGLKNLEFIRESLKDGKIIDTSTYQFFLSEDEIQILARELVVVE